MTVTPVDTVQHWSPISQTPVPPSGVYFNLENNEDEMGPELEKLESSTASTGLETPGQQCAPTEGNARLYNLSSSARGVSDVFIANSESSAELQPVTLAHV